MIMVNHAAYPLTPSGDHPASASPYWITTVLRKRIGYRGLIFSDDLEMGGILKFMPIEEAALAAIRAGMDLLEICHSPDLILRAYEALLSEAERSTAFRKLLLMRAAQTAKQRARHFAGGFPRSLSAQQFDALRTRITCFSQTIINAQPLPQKAHPA
jgi:beta-N-acetylhexosaminidase